MKINEHEIELSYFGSTIKFDKEIIIRIAPYSGWFSRGLRFEHRDPDAPRFVVFWTFTPKQVEKALFDFGYGEKLNCQSDDVFK
jgi:hypothetical protein